MIRLIRVMLNLPIDVFVSGTYLIARSLQEVVNPKSERLALTHAPVDRISRSTDSRSSVISAPDVVYQFSSPDEHICTRKHDSEPTPMAYYDDDSIDLSDNSYIKVVRYRVVYTRRGYEAVLPIDDNGTLFERVVTVIRDTTADEIRGELKTKYLASLPKPVPDSWKNRTDPLKGLKPPDSIIDYSVANPMISGLSQEDRDDRVVVSLELLSRIRRPEKEYERDQAKALEGIEGVLKERL